MNEERVQIIGNDMIIDSSLWHACAGRLVHVPPVNSTVSYFPQGHFEHAGMENTDDAIATASRIPWRIQCRVTSVELKMDSRTEEVYTKIHLNPIVTNNNSTDDDKDYALSESLNLFGRSQFLTKVLTQSDANNGGGFSVPKKLAETIFPPLNYKITKPGIENLPSQDILARDYRGNIWKFRHVYRGNPLRHLLTTGWSKFVTAKQVVSGDTIVFGRDDNGDVYVGIRRVRRARWQGRIRAESVLEAARLAAIGRGFEVRYYPSSSTTEFCVVDSVVNATKRKMVNEFGAGTRIKMAFETLNSTGVEPVGWYKGSIESVEDVDPNHWPGSLWRRLKVRWDVDAVNLRKQINPWLVQVVSTRVIQTYDRKRGGEQLEESNHVVKKQTVYLFGAPIGESKRRSG
ncbi:auxin response factor 18-like [Cannabis sativa]|uniref:auxin response factor 18-like n=1 Tax=Cannabis sativa TaxID=3483 RepID=UPI0011E06FB1|nr:auxin response factor 18-like [Cannabis sativa]